MSNPLPTTIAECHALIRELMAATDDLSLEELGVNVAMRLGCSPQQGCVLVVLALANGRQMSAAQIETRLPERHMSRLGQRTVKCVNVHVYHVRRRLGEDVILSNKGPSSGYHMSAVWIAGVREAMK